MNERDEDEWPKEFLYNLPLFDIFNYEPINQLAPKPIQ